jgi:hypothetical protein
MLNKRAKIQRCKAKGCTNRFEADEKRPWIKWCSEICQSSIIKDISDKAKAKTVKEYKDRARFQIKGLREKHKGLAYYKKELKTILHKYVRLRDANNPCCACGRPMAGRKGDASHFWSVGSYPNLQFDERNIHLGCVPCNQHRGGNLIEYAMRLPTIIGQDAYNELEAARNVRANFNIPDLQDKIKHYKALVEDLEMRRDNPE